MSVLHINSNADNAADLDVLMFHVHVSIWYEVPLRNKPFLRPINLHYTLQHFFGVASKTNCRDSLNDTKNLLIHNS